MALLQRRTQPASLAQGRSAYPTSCFDWRHGPVKPHVLCVSFPLVAKFDFDDFLKQYKMVAGMGNMGQIMKMLPGKRRVSFVAPIYV